MHELSEGALYWVFAWCQGRWGRVHKGRWHGEVAIRLLEIDGNNQDHLKLFKKEVMNYRQTRHENVVLFMGACMAPPHLAIITRWEHASDSKVGLGVSPVKPSLLSSGCSFCKGRTLYSVVRDTKNTLDINKTRQIAQEIVKVFLKFFFFSIQKQRPCAKLG